MATCPRCNKNNLDFPELSRWDNKTEICGRCGTAEAMEQFFFGGMLTPWHLIQRRGEDARVAEFMAMSDSATEELERKLGKPDAS